VQNAITLLQARGVKVMLSVGGATYKFPTTYTAKNASCLWDLALDLGCDGVDIDWEAAEGVSKGQQFVDIINMLQIYRPTTKKVYLSAACFSVGAYAPTPNNPNCGMNILGLQQAGKCLDWINVMSYDAGPPSAYDCVAAYTAYKMYYPGAVYLGLEIGDQAWGGYRINNADVGKATKKAEGVVIWSLQKKADNAQGKTVSPELPELLTLATLATVPVVIPPVTIPTPPVKVITNTVVTCPSCQKMVNLSLTYLPK